jgi:hypothetical protein
MALASSQFMIRVTCSLSHLPNPPRVGISSCPLRLEVACLMKTETLIIHLKSFLSIRGARGVLKRFEAYSNLYDFGFEPTYQ